MRRPATKAPMPSSPAKARRETDEDESSCAPLLNATVQSRNDVEHGESTLGITSLLSSHKLTLLATMFGAYAMVIFSSSSFEVSIPGAMEDAALGLDQADFALAMAVGQMATVVGKLVCGFVVDIRGASSAFYEALFLIGCTMLLGLWCLKARFHSGALLCFVALKLIKSAVWPAMAKAAKATFDSAVFGRVWGVLVSSSRFGAVCGGLVLSPLVVLGWVWPGLVVACGLFGMAALLRAQTISDMKLEESSSASVAAPVSLREAVSLYGKNRQLQLIVASEAMLLAVMDTSALLPLYLHSHLGADLDTAAQLASLFPLGMVLATFAGGFMYDALGPAMRASVLLALGVCSAGSYAVLATTRTPWRAGLLLFFAGGCIAPAKYLPPTLFALDNVDPQHSGKVIALIDVPGYFVSAVFFRAYPVFVAAWGWSAVWFIAGGMVLVSTVCIVCQQRLEAYLLQGKISKPTQV